MKDCHRCGWIFDDKEDFCPECGIENFSDFVTSANKDGLSAKVKEPFGAWVLKGSNPPLYTRIVTDDIKHKATGKKYRRGEYVLFWASRGQPPPPLIEDTDDFRIIYHKSIFEKIVIKD